MFGFGVLSFSYVVQLMSCFSHFLLFLATALQYGSPSRGVLDLPDSTTRVPTSPLTPNIPNYALSATNNVSLTKDHWSTSCVQHYYLGNDHILLICCMFSQFTHTHPVHRIDSASAAGIYTRCADVRQSLVTQPSSSPDAANETPTATTTAGLPEPVLQAPHSTGVHLI